MSDTFAYRSPRKKLVSTLRVSTSLKRSYSKTKLKLFSSRGANLTLLSGVILRGVILTLNEG